MSTWRELIELEMSQRDETFEDIEASAPPVGPWLDVEFDASWGIVFAAPFTLWTARRVYFPVVSDCSEWAGSVARHPDGKPTEHIGG